MKTALRTSLTDDQYDRLKRAALTRYQQISEEGERSKMEDNLRRYELRAEGDYSDRQLPGIMNRPLQKIFGLKNETLGIVRSVKRFLLARVCKDLFGGEPFFYVRPEGKVDKELAEAMQKHAGWKLRLAQYKAKIKRAIDTLLDVGYVPIKTTWDVQEDVSESLEMILVHKSDGVPVVTDDGDYIYEDDETTEVQSPVANQGPGEDSQSEAPEQNEQQVQAAGGEQAEMESVDPEDLDQGQDQSNAQAPQPPMLAFVKAPEVVMDAEKYTWREHLVEQRVRLYNGLRIDPCERKDVFWPMNVPDIEEADMTAHRFDCKLSELRAKYAPKSFEDQDEDEDGSETESDGDEDDQIDSEVADILDGLKHESQSPKSEADKPYKNEAEVSGQEEDPTIQVAECSFDFDCFEDGRPRRLHLVLLPQQQECIYAEYRAALAPRAAKNIHMLAINRRKNRAYGRGLYEVYENLADAADQLLNAILYRNQYVSDPTKIWNPQNTVEGKANPDLKFEPGSTYSTSGPQIDPKNILTAIELPDLDERTWKLMELFMQLIQLDSGVTNANQGDVSNLPSNSTATGINSMLESSSVLHQYVLEEIRDCLTPQLAFAVGLIYLRQDQDETYEYLTNDDDPAAQQVMLLKDARKLRHLPMNVDILLTRTKRQEWREASTAAIPIGVQYGQLAPPDQARMREAFVQLFRALDFENPEDFFPKPNLDAAPPSPPPPKATEAITMKGEDLSPTQRDALAQQFGLPATTPGELQGAHQAISPPASGAPVQPAPSIAAASSGPLPSNVIDDNDTKLPDNRSFDEDAPTAETNL